MHHVFDRWERWAGELRTRTTGAIVADRRGKSASYALLGLQDRGTLFIGPGEEVYEGMVIGENARAEDMDVNAIKEKQQTNMRAAAADVLERMAPPKRVSLEAAVEFLREDECVEVTPESIRLRKVELDKTRRQKAARQNPAAPRVA
jgi:GTP-binding protein